MKSIRHKNIGIALSGGGVRALAFHLGVLKWLDDAGLWPQISYLSTVSGGSLAIGMVFAANSGRWPEPGQFKTKVFPVCQRWLTTQSIQSRYTMKCLKQPWKLGHGRAFVLAQTLSELWEYDQTLQELPDSPVWRINCTCYESGKNWRFSKEKMGDYVVGYYDKPDEEICDAIAASAAFPGLIGPLTLELNSKKLRTGGFGARVRDGIDTNFSRVHLWDGAIYENLGLEPIFKGKSFEHEVDFLIVSDASLGVGLELGRQKRKRQFVRPLRRLLDVSMDQVRSLRTRAVMTYFRSNKNSGMHLRIGNTAKFIFESANLPIAPSTPPFLDDETIKRVAKLSTNLRRLENTVCQALVQHGFETAKCTFEAYCSDD